MAMISVCDANKRKLIRSQLMSSQTIYNWDDLHMAGPHSIREKDNHGGGDGSPVGLLCLYLNAYAAYAYYAHYMLTHHYNISIISITNIGDGCPVGRPSSRNVRSWHCCRGGYFFLVFVSFSWVFIWSLVGIFVPFVWLWLAGFSNVSNCPIQCGSLFCL